MSRIRKIGSAILDGLDRMAVVSHDGTSRARIEEIDDEIVLLRRERDHLIANLYEPRADEVVSDDYVPGAYQPQPKVWKHDHTESVGRLTTCKGRNTSSRYHDAHPGCPYIETIHTSHEFTLRD